MSAELNLLKTMNSLLLELQDKVLKTQVNQRKQSKSLMLQNGKKEIDKEHVRMMQHKAWIAVPRSEVPKGTKILGSTWAMKRKVNGTRRSIMMRITYHHQ
jgi:hypothetical protein